MGTSCPNCSADTGEYDSEAGANFCQSCGFQISVEELCSEVERNPDGQQYGTFVAANGRVAGESLAVPAVTRALHALIRGGPTEVSVTCCASVQEAEVGMDTIRLGEPPSKQFRLDTAFCAVVQVLSLCCRSKP